MAIKVKELIKTIIKAYITIIAIVIPGEILLTIFNIEDKLDPLNIVLVFLYTTGSFSLINWALEKE